MSRINDEKRYKSNQKTPTTQPQRGEWGTGKFISINLNKEEKEAFASYPDRWEKNQMDSITPILELGYKLGVRYNRKLGCFQATLTGLEECELNAGVTLSTYHIDCTRSVAIMLFAVSTKYLLDREWASATAIHENDW